MTYTFKLSRRLARLRGPACAAALLALVGCSDSDSFAPGSETPGNAPSTHAPALGSSFVGGIPFGMFAQPTNLFGDRYNGALRNISPNQLLDELAAIKSRGGRVVLMFAGSQPNYLNNDGTFSLSMWKERIDRFRSVNFGSYISDGTIIAHYLIDEPYDPANFAGQPVPGATLEAMAKYSKSIWPNMVTVVRAEPTKIKWSGTYQYLDAAWAQYLARKGDVNSYLQENVSTARQMGLGLIVGLNLLDGGNPHQTPMSPSEVQSYGSALLSSSYPCAFISWEYNTNFINTSGMGAAMDALRAKAQNRATASCRDGSSTEPPPEDPPAEEPPAEQPPAEEPPPPPTTSPSPSTALPFGLALAPQTEYTGAWTGSVLKATPSTLMARLNQAAQSRMKLVVMLANKPQVRNADGTFNLTKWKAEVDEFRSLTVGSHITSGTYYLHYLVDQPNCASCWGGKSIPWSTVEEMAKYSKTIWPNLPTVVRALPSQLAEAPFRWSYLDAGWAQYSTNRGEVRTFLATQVARAKDEGLGVVAGLNVNDASGYGTAAMTASQIKAFGTVVASNPYVCAVADWSYDASYLSQTGIRAAFDSVAKVAKGRSAGACLAH